MQGNDQHFHVNTIKLHVRCNSEQVVERTRQLFNTMTEEMQKGMLGMSVCKREKRKKSKYPMHI